MKIALIRLLLASVFFWPVSCLAQNQLAIPPVLNGPIFNLNVEDSITQFWPGINTITYGVNGNILGPTLIFNKGDSVTLNVTNNLTGAGNSTTMHWHGLHVPAMADGGPHMVINQGATWSPSFKVMNDAGTFWYHPHGLNKTDRHVSKGVAGFIIVRDSQEAALTLPRTYGQDDFPLVIQTKEFDILNQIAIATFMDTTVMVNGTLNPYLNVPGQMVRLRLLNGASQRTFRFGFSNNMNFYLIGNDGGLLDAPTPMTRLTLSNGERAEILLDFSTLINDTVYLKCFGSELQKGIYGADSVGDNGVNQIPDYYNNPLNGIDFNILELRVGSQTPNPVTIVPLTLIPQTPLVPDVNTVYRRFEIDTMGSMGVTPNYAFGPFAFNQVMFDIDSINEYVILNSKEVWTIFNKSMIAHPFHIHDVQFNILDISGNPAPAYERGKKDVVMILPGDSVRFITQFTDFADDMVPYMYHCHILHHEDDGMMGSFLVIDTTGTTGLDIAGTSTGIQLYPVPVTDQLKVRISDAVAQAKISVYTLEGRIVLPAFTIHQQAAAVNLAYLLPGVYLLTVQTDRGIFTEKFVKQ